ncbi:MAG: WD40 repeat domain-containing protein [Chloroflexi bacterium]|nr:WD40 repeat domain-containing protein [Chloroflexota bacterium]
MHKIALLLLITLTILPQMRITAQDGDSSRLEVITPDNIRRMQEIQRLGRGWPSQIALSPDGQYLIILTGTGLWRLDMQHVDTEPEFLRPIERVSNLQFSEQGDYLIAEIYTDNYSNRYLFLETETWKTIKTVRETIYGSIWDTVREHPIEGLLYIQNTRTNYEIRRVLDDELIYSIPVTEHRHDIFFSPDIQYAVMEYVNDVRTGYDFGLLDITTNQILNVFEAGEIFWSPSSEYFLNNKGTTFEVWHAPSGQLLWTESGEFQNSVPIWTLDDRFVIHDWRDLDTVWDAPTGDRLDAPENDSREYQFRFSQDGRFAIGTGVDKESMIFVWDLEANTRLITYLPVNEYSEALYDQYQLLITHDHRLIIEVDSDDVVRIRARESAEVIRNIRFSGFAESLLFHPQEDILISGSGERQTISNVSDDNSIVFWDLNSGEPIKELQGHEDRVWDMDITEDGQYLLSHGLRYGGLRLWNMETEEYLYDFWDELYWQVGVNFAPDNRDKILVSVGQTEADFPPIAFDIEWPLSPSAKPTGVQTGISAVSNNGQYLAYGHLLFDITEGFNLLYEGEFEVDSNAFSPDDRYLASGEVPGIEETVLVLRDVPSMEILNRWLIHNESLYGGTNWPRVVFSSDGKILAASGARYLLLIDMNTQSVISRQFLRTQIRSIAFSYDGKRLALGYADGTISIYGVPAN